MAQTFDAIVIGAGLVGLATARALLALQPKMALAILEKEAGPGRHQSGHNSGVIHGGIYYRPGSLKARLCIAGAQEMSRFADGARIAVGRCGKVICASGAREEAALEALYGRGLENGVPGLRRITGAELAVIEPAARATAALHAPDTAIIDYRQVAAALAEGLLAQGAEIHTGTGVLAAAPRGRGHCLRTPAGSFCAPLVVNCAGLHADTIAQRMGAAIDVRIVPFRGEYYVLRRERRGLVRGLIYPTPDPAMPFLGVHFTPRIDGSVEAGPNAVLALAREGYTRWRVHPGEVLATMGYRGFWALCRSHWRSGLYEAYRSLSKAAFVASLQRLVPAITAADLRPGGAGVRAQAVDRQGALVDDFRIVVADGAIHVLNAPSPAATASLAIGRHIATLALAAAG